MAKSCVLVVVEDSHVTDTFVQGAENLEVVVVDFDITLDSSEIRSKIDEIEATAGSPSHCEDIEDVLERLREQLEEAEAEESEEELEDEEEDKEDDYDYEDEEDEEDEDY